MTKYFEERKIEWNKLSGNLAENLILIDTKDPLKSRFAEFDTSSILLNFEFLNRGILKEPLMKYIAAWLLILLINIISNFHNVLSDTKVERHDSEVVMQLNHFLPFVSDYQ